MKDFDHDVHVTHWTFWLIAELFFLYWIDHSLKKLVWQVNRCAKKFWAFNNAMKNPLIYKNDSRIFSYMHLQVVYFIVTFALNY